MNQNHPIIMFSLEKRIKAFLIGCMIFCSLQAVGQIHLIFNQESDQSILDIASEELGVKFNYNHDILSNQKHTFSFYENQERALIIIGQKLGLNLVKLEDRIYALNKSNDPIARDEVPSITFTVKDLQGNTLPFCNVTLPDLDLIFETDINGNCTIKGYYSIPDKVVLSYIGYQTYNTNIGEIMKNNNVVMKTASHVLGEITLIDFLSSFKTNNIQNVTQLQDIITAGQADQDILKKAQLLPGIHSTSESLNDLQIRGGPPDQVSYKWNNIRLLQTSLFYGQVSGVNPFMVDDIGITRNGTSADQSGQASGSILLKSVDKVNNRLGIHFFTDLLYSNIGINLPIIENKLSAKVSYRKSHNFLFDSNIYNNYFDQIFQFGQLTNDQFYIDFFDIRGQENITRKFNFDDISTSIIWKPNSKTSIKTSFIGIGNNFEYNYFDGFFSEETKSDQLSVSNLGWNVTAKYKVLPNLEFKSSYSGSQYKNHYLFERDRGRTLGEDRFKENNVNQNTVNVSARYSKKHFNIEAGIQNENWEVEYIDTTRNPSIGLSYTISERATKEFSTFTKIQWKFIPNTIIETGIRYSDFGFSLVDRKFIEPRIHISSNISSNLTLHGHYGLFHQNLNRRIFSAPLETEKGIWYLSDERPESDNFIWVVQNNQTSIGAKYLWNRWKFTIDAYTKDANNIWTSALDFAVEEDPFSFADLKVNGLELSSQYQNKKWRLVWTYELTDETMTIKRDQYYKIKSPFTQRHKLSLMQSYTNKDWTISTRWRINSGRRYSKGERFVVETDPELYYGLEYESTLEESITPYHSLDVSIIKKWKLGTENNRNIELGLHVQNIYNRKNIIKRQYFVDYTKTPFEMSFYDRKGLGFTPNLSLQVSL